MVKRSKSYAIPENQGTFIFFNLNFEIIWKKIYLLFYLVLPCQFITSKPLRALNKFRTDGLKKTWKRGDKQASSNRDNFIKYEYSFNIKPSLLKNQMTAKSSLSHSIKSNLLNPKESKIKKLDKLKNNIETVKTLNKKKVNFIDI